LPVRKCGRKKTKRPFDETRVGYFLKREAPVEYRLIMNSINFQAAPSAALIEEIGYASDNPLFKKPKFRRSLISYRKKGLDSKISRKPTVQTELFYIRIRQNRLKRKG
jgi:hypothetical protein